jgi:hypothetical protein
VCVAVRRAQSAGESRRDVGHDFLRDLLREHVADVRGRGLEDTPRQVAEPGPIDYSIIGESKMSTDETSEPTPATIDPSLTSHPNSDVYQQEASESLLTHHLAEDGTQIPIERDWVESQKPHAFDDVPMEERPFRVNQDTPRKVHVALRESKNPLYYFRRVRWIQEAGLKGEKRFLERVYYTTVRIDLSKVKAAHLFMKPFGPGGIAAHAALHLEMEPGGFTSLDGEDGNGFVLSFEAHMRAGQGYSALDGRFDAYPGTHVVGNYPDFLFRSLVLDYPHILLRRTLILSQDELRELGLAVGRTIVLSDPDITDLDLSWISEATGREHSRGEVDRHYNSMRRSCVHAVIHVLNEALAPERRIKLRWLGGAIPNPRLMIPSLAHRALKRQGLIDGEVLKIEAMEDGHRLARM